MTIHDVRLAMIFTLLTEGLMAGGWDAIETEGQQTVREWRTGRSWIRNMGTNKWAEATQDADVRAPQITRLAA
jgi:hypothetical protein